MLKKYLSLICLISFFLISFSQEKNNTIPNDPSIKTGTFSNGLKYYIKNNSRPADKIELRLVVKAGSILEDKDQQGLAHFLEHMCFNGTKHFKKNELIDYLQSIGVEFGAHVNASTSFDKTIYKLSLPSNDPEILEKGFQILEDWAFNVSLTTEEINKERGVVLEEYRRRLGVNDRMRKIYFPKLYYKSKYAERLPIGKKEVIENFKPEALKRFYKDWYRPDLMAVIVSGDIDVDILEAKIKLHFDKANQIKNPRERIIYKDENHKETFLEIISDEEASANNIFIRYKSLDIKKEENSIKSYKERVIKSLFNIMINNRLSDLKNTKNPPFLYGRTSYSKSLVNREIFESYARVNGDSYLEALEALLIENERVKKYGFQEAEFKRAKENLLSKIDVSYGNKNKSTSSQFLGKMIRNFTKDMAMPSIDWVYDFYHNEIPNIQMYEVDNLIEKSIRKENRILIISGKDIKLTKKQILELINSVENNKNIKPYIEKKVRDELLVSIPQKGSIIKEENKSLEIKKIILSNGVVVHYKKTNFDDNKVKFKCRSRGGTSLLSSKDYMDTKLALNKLTQAGIVGLSISDLKKVLNGKRASLKPYISEKIEGMNGSSTTKDLETLFQLIYAHFTQLNNDKEAFDIYRSKAKISIENQFSKPSNYFWNEFYKFEYQGYDRYKGFPLAEDYDNTNYELAYKIYQERFKNALDFDFVFVGNFDEDKLKEYSEIYLASLPSSKNKEEYIDDGFFPISSDTIFTVKKGIEDKSLVYLVYRGKHTYSKKDKMSLYLLKDILSIKLNEILREETSKVYSPKAKATFNHMSNSFNLSISYSCAPENVDKLIELTKSIIDDIIKNGPTKKDLTKVKKASLLKRKEFLKNNSFWISVISNYVFYNKDFERLYDYNKMLTDITEKEIQELATNFLSQGPVVGVLLPENKVIKVKE